MNLNDMEWLQRLGAPLGDAELREVARDLISFAIDNGFGNILLECLVADELHGNAPNARFALLIGGERVSYNDNVLCFDTGLRLGEALHAVVNEGVLGEAHGFDKDLRAADTLGEFLSLPSGRAARLRFRQSSANNGIFMSLRPSKIILDGNARLTAMWEAFVIAGVSEEPLSERLAGPRFRL